MHLLDGGSKVRELEAKLKALNRSQAIIEFDLEGKILTANENFLKAMGYSLSEIQGKHHRMFVEPTYATSEDYRQFWVRLRRGEPQTAQFMRVGKGGKLVWIEASYNPLLDGQGRPYKIVKYAFDITAQKIRDADLMAQLNAIARSQAVIEFEMDGTIITANENFLGAMGYTLAEVKGRPHSIFVDPSFANSVEYRNFWDRLRRGEAQTAQFRRIGKGGREVWIEATYNPILDLVGKPYKVVKFAMDVTPRKQATARLSTKVKELVAMMSMSATELQATAQSLASTAEQTSHQSGAVATASEQLSASAIEIARQIIESARVVGEAVDGTKTSEHMVGGLIEAAKKISYVSNVVAQIAGQTNLLALNATIEAARAGEAGKGFAVVASEVKSLANQTAKATEEIGQHVDGIQSASQETARGIKQISDVIARVSEISTSISGAVEQQSAATREVTQNISGVRHAAEDTSRSSATLLQVSRDLAERANAIDREVTEFALTV